MVPLRHVLCFIPVGICFADVHVLAHKAEPNPPDFGSNVVIIEPGNFTAEQQKKLGDIYWHGRDWSNPSQFGNRRTAVFLKPGNHSVDINVPYYFSVLGLGLKPGDVAVHPGPQKIGIQVDLQDNKHSLNAFWRSLENLQTFQWRLNWWVSQAAPIRSVIVEGELFLSGGPPASGGCLANSQVKGRLETGSQQQWYARGNSMRPFPRASWRGSYVCVGCLDATQKDEPFKLSYSWNASKQSHHTGLSYTEPPEVFAEKPHVAFRQGRYYLSIPKVRRKHWGHDWDPGDVVDFKMVFVVREDSTASEINAKMASGLHVVFPPGIYTLDAPLEINRTGTVLLGLGYATLVPKYKHRALIRVNDADNVRIAGLILQAGPEDLQTRALLQWGAEGSDYKGDPAKPGIMHDLVFRVGGPDWKAVGTRYMLQVNNGWVLGDNLWMWAADHCVDNVGLCCKPARKVETALQVNGPNVHMYGISAEHTEGDIVEWNGRAGSVSFLQTEFRYDKPSTADYWSRSAAMRITPSDFRGVSLDIYVVMVWGCRDKFGHRLPRLRMEGGFSAFVLKDPSNWSTNYKDINGVNFASYWPKENCLSCLVWHDHDSQSKCVEDLYAHDGSSMVKAPDLGTQSTAWLLLQSVTCFVLAMSLVALLRVVVKRSSGSRLVERKSFLTFLYDPCMEASCTDPLDASPILLEQTRCIATDSDEELIRRANSYSDEL